jgi:hypothetical protein
MSAKPNDYQVVTKSARRIQSVIAVSLGAILSFLIYSQFAKSEVTDPKMESACKFPRNEGEMTVITVMNGKLICWRWQ